MKKQLDGCYTRMLRMALNVSFKQHIPNIQLYGELPPVSTTVQQRRMRLAGHCVRHDDEVLWQPTDGHANRGRQTMTYVDNMLQDTWLGNTSELQTVMMDRGCWKGCVFSAGRLERRPIWERWDYVFPTNNFSFESNRKRQLNDMCLFRNNRLPADAEGSGQCMSFVWDMAPYTDHCEIVCNVVY